MTVVVAVAGVAMLVASGDAPSAGGRRHGDGDGRAAAATGAWSLSAAANPSLNTTLPQAGPQQGASGASFGSQAFDSGRRLGGLAEDARRHCRDLATRRHELSECVAPDRGVQRFRDVAGRLHGQRQHDLHRWLRRPGGGRSRCATSRRVRAGGFGGSLPRDGTQSPERTRRPRCPASSAS